MKIKKIKVEINITGDFNMKLKYSMYEKSDMEIIDIVRYIFIKDVILISINFTAILYLTILTIIKESITAITAPFIP